MDSKQFDKNSSSSAATTPKVSRAESDCTEPSIEHEGQGQQPQQQLPSSSSAPTTAGILHHQQHLPPHSHSHGPHHHHHTLHHHHHHHLPHEPKQPLTTSTDSLPTPPLLTISSSILSGFAAAAPISTASDSSQPLPGTSSNTVRVVGTSASTAHSTGTVTATPMSASSSSSSASSSPTHSSSLISGESFTTKKLRLEIKSEPRSSSSPTPPPLNQSTSSSSSGGGSVAAGSSAAVNNDLHSWQETKRTIKDRTSCLVNSERLSDVTFLVGPNEYSIYGHKTILSLGSPYFEKLFFGPMAEKKTQIKIPDIEPEIFLTFLKYLYTDEFDNTMDDSDTLMLLKPAKVYIVPHLAEKCTALLVERMNPENVLVIYNRALVFDEPKLADFCLRFVDRQIDKIVTTENFLYMEAEILCTLLERDNLRIDECTLFKAVVKWTEMECSRQNLEFNSENSRSVLGRALYMIRFPTMLQEEFCLEVVPTDILNKDEIISVFMNLCIGNELRYFRPATQFSTSKRIFKPKLHYLNRFSDVLSKVLTVNNSFGSTSDVLYSSKLRFQCDQRIFIHGLGVYAVASPIPNIRFNATAAICKAQNTLSGRTSDGSGRSYDFRMPFQVMFDKPIEVLADEEYLLTAALKIVRESLPNSNSNLFGTFGTNTHYGSTVNIDAYYGTKAHSAVKITCTDGVTVNFTFHVPSCYHIGETFSLGQIPQIIFSV